MDLLQVSLVGDLDHVLNALAQRWNPRRQVVVRNGPSAIWDLAEALPEGGVGTTGASCSRGTGVCSVGDVDLRHCDYPREALPS